MTRLTTKDSIMGRKHDIKCGCASVWKTKLKNYRYELIEDVVDKLGQLEDILEKHYILTFEELEICIENGEKTLDEFVKWRENRFCELVKPYKDIEEELGIDLITLFKAMKNGIWSKGSFYDDKISDTPTFIARPEISLCGYYEEVNDDCETIKREENVWCIYTYDFELQIRQTMLKDYGKTRALDKKELE